MAGTPKRRVSPVRFAHFDEELEDSDQTISVHAHARPSSHRRLGPASRNPRAPPPFHPIKSSFFAETSEDEVSAALPAATLSTRTGDSVRSMTRPPLLDPRTMPLYIGDIQFPATRSVLWDRRALGDTVGLSATRSTPKFHIGSSTLKKLHQLYKHVEVVDGSRPVQLVELWGDLVGGIVRLGLEKAGSNNGLTWRVPVYAAGESTDISFTQSEQDALIAESISCWSNCALEGLHMNYFPSLFVSASGHKAQLKVRLQCHVPTASFDLTPIRNLPILMTALGAALTRSQGSPHYQRSGFVTLDRARKAVPLLKEDPLVSQRPVVGLWFSGNVGTLIRRGEDSSESDQLGELYLACINYLLTTSVKERVEIDEKTFLVVVYPKSSEDDAPSLIPQFFECRYSNFTNPEPRTKLVYDNKSCMSGLPSYCEDVLFDFGHVCGSWGRLNIEPTSGGEHVEEPSQLPSRAIRSFSRSAESRHDVEATDGKKPNASALDDSKITNENMETVSSNGASFKTCCKSQQLLTQQHQQMLEHQQKQLVEMQAQIKRLQKLLAKSRGGSSKIDDTDRFSSASFQNSHQSMHSEVPSIENDDPNRSQVSSISSSVIDKRFGGSFSRRSQSVASAREATIPQPGSVSEVPTPQRRVSASSEDVMSVDELETPTAPKEGMVRRESQERLNMPPTDSHLGGRNWNGDEEDDILLEMSLLSNASFNHLKTPDSLVAAQRSLIEQPEITVGAAAILSNSSIPRIKFHHDDYLYDSDDEELKHIERKYAVLFRS